MKSALVQHVVFLFSCLSLAAFAPVSSHAQDASEDDSDAVILLEDITYEVSGNDATLKVHKKIRVNNADKTGFGHLAFDESEFVELKKFDGRVFDMDGNELYACSKGDAEPDCGYAEYALFEDVCVRYYSLVSDRYPFIVEYEYEEKLKSLMFWPDWHPQKTVPVLSSSYTLIVPNDFAFEMSATDGVPDPSVTERGSKTTYLWHMTDVPAIEREDYAPRRIESASRLCFAPGEFELDGHEFTGRSWASLGDGYRELSKKCFKLKGRQKEMCHRLAEGDRGAWETCESLHSYLTDKLRYVAIQIGIGGWQPTPANETLARGYGDCKDMSALYVAMLREIGIDAHLAVVRRGETRYTDPDLPRISRFNHVIVMAMIDKDTVWTDPTCEYCAFGDLPWDVENRYAMCVLPDSAYLIRTAASSTDSNVVFRTACISFGDRRTLTASIDFTMIGNLYQWGKSYIARYGRKELARLLKHDMFGLSDRFHVDSVKCPVIDDTLRELTIHAFGRVRNAVHTAGEQKYVDVSMLNEFRSSEKVSLEDRTQPIDLMFPVCYHDSISVIPQDGWYLAETIEPDTLVSEFGSTLIHLRQEGERIILSRIRKSDVYAIEPDQFGQYKAALDRLKETQVAFIVLEQR